MTLTLQGIPSRSSCIFLSPSNIEKITQGRLTINGMGERNNVVAFHPNFHEFRGNARINFWGSGNFLYLDQNSPLEGEINFPEDDGCAYIYGGMPTLRLTAGIYKKSTFVWGFETVSFGTSVWVHGGCTCNIGEKGLWSEGIQVRTSDHHAIVDLGTGTILNSPRDVLIGRRVWIGAQVCILKGTQISDGSIVGARTVVSGPIGENELWAGTPARKLRGNVSWSGVSDPSPEAIKNLISGNV
ncbi:hypothetical protein QQM41_08035 [Acetobacter sp. AC2005]|uniref:hypothetical protein n=1 Tax=Acetobacter sp. AC2005 TaxID=3134142 RepID=UPI0030D36D60